jgi:hypothetical protein
MPADQDPWMHSQVTKRVAICRLRLAGRQSIARTCYLLSRCLSWAMCWLGMSSAEQEHVARREQAGGGRKEGESSGAVAPLLQTFIASASGLLRGMPSGPRLGFLHHHLRPISNVVILPAPLHTVCAHGRDAMTFSLNRFDASRRAFAPRNPIL